MTPALLPFFRTMLTEVSNLMKTIDQKCGGMPEACFVRFAWISNKAEKNFGLGPREGCNRM